MCHSVGVSRTSAGRVVDPLRREVDREVLGLDGRFLLGRRRPAQRSPEPGQELVHPERLRHEVVGPGVERSDLVALGLADRQDDDRDCAPAAQAANDLDAVDPRQAEVEHDDVGVVAGSQGKCRLSRRRQVDVVPARLQVRPERAEDLRLVVDDEDAGHPAVRRRITTVSPPPGVSSTSISPPIASTNPFATARPEPDALVVAGVAEALERQEHALPLVERHSRPAVDDPHVHDVRRWHPPSLARARPAGENRTAFCDDVGEGAFEQPASAMTRGSVSGTSTSTASSSRPRL